MYLKIKQIIEQLIDRISSKMMIFSQFERLIYLWSQPRFPQLFHRNLCVVVVMEGFMTFLVAGIVFQFLTQELEMVKSIKIF